MPVEFEGDFRRPQAPFPTGGMNTAGNQTPGMTGWLLRKGIIKDESQAKALLLGVVCVNFVLIILILIFFVF